MSLGRKIVIVKSAALSYSHREVEDAECTAHIKN